MSVVVYNTPVNTKPPLHVYRCREINSRNRLFGKMKYQIIITNVNNYVITRSWCFRTFGESVEYQIFEYSEKLNLDPVWSWDTKDDSRWKGHIYLKDDYELELFEKNFPEMFIRR